MKKILLLLFSVLLLLSCKDEESKGRIYFAEEEIDLISLSKYQLKVINETPGFETLKYTFKSSDTKIVEVNEDGMITGRAVGTATVTATAEELGLSATCRINVKSYKITLSQETITLKPNETYELSVTISPEPETMPEIKWQTDDKDVAIVDNGKIIAINSGETTITASIIGDSTRCKVIVKHNELTLNLEIPGTLKDYLNQDISKLTITGNINAMDINTMKEATKLINIDMSKAHIISYQDTYDNYIADVLPKNAFNNSQITICKLPTNLKIIDEKAFYQCRKLISITIPETVEKISESAFVSCTSLKSIHLPNSLESIENAAFLLSGIESIVIPPKIKKIPNNSFNGSKLSSITLPENLEYIGILAFASSNIKEITLPSKLDSLGWSCFSACTSLTSIHSLNPNPPSVDKDRETFWNTEFCKLNIPKGSYDKYNTTPGWMEFQNIIEE